MFFSSNTPSDVKKTLTLIAGGVKAKNSFEKSLGLPAVIGRKKPRSFQSILDRTWKRISNWKFIYLSNVGKETLIRSVLQAIPIYFMSIFLLPKSITSKLNALISKFWWGFNGD